MLKKIILGVCVALALGLFLFYQAFPGFIYDPHGYCAFCDEKIIAKQYFYEDDLVFAAYTHKPILPGHCLVIPKRHVERFEDLTDEEIVRIGQVIKKVNQAVALVFKTSSYLLLQKNGTEVGQTVPHVHFHYIPRRAGDDSTLKFLYRFYVASFEKPLSPEAIQTITTQLRAAMPSAIKIN